MLSHDVIPFEFEKQQIKVHLDSQGTPWLEAQEVCAVLDIHDVSKAVARLKLGEKRTSKSRNVLIINESGLYRLIFRSNKPAAERFQDWVFEEVLPSIRKTGRYLTGGEQLPPEPPDTLAQIMACAEALKTFGTFDDRDRIMFSAKVRQVAELVMGRATGTVLLLESPKTPQVWTLSMRLSYLEYPPLRGAEGESLQIKIGSAAAKAYRRTYKAEPLKLWDFVKGQQRQVNAYAADRVEVLDTAIRAFLDPTRRLPSPDAPEGLFTEDPHG